MYDFFIYERSNREPILGFYKEENKQQITIRYFNKVFYIMEVKLFMSAMESSNHNRGLEGSVNMGILQHFPL